MNTKPFAALGRLPRFAVGGLAALALTWAGVTALPAQAEAYNAIRQLDSIANVSCEGSSPRDYWCNSIDDIFDCTEDMLSTRNNPLHVDEVTITLYQDLDTSDYGVLKFADGYTYNINLQGHMINRGLAKANTDFSGSGNGEVIRLDKGTKVNINGGEGNDERLTEHLGTTVTDKLNGTFWKYDGSAVAASDSTSALYGGLITGGANDDSNGGGGISVKDENAKLTLTNVTVAGNISDTYADYCGYGGGITTLGEVTLNNSKVMYNHAESYGGGIYLKGESAKLSLTNGSNVSYNTSIKEGGGIDANIDGANARIDINDSEVSYNRAGKDGGGINLGDSSASQQASLSLINSKVQGNVSSWAGGGIALDCSGTTHHFMVTNSTISDNVAAAYGGAIYAKKDINCWRFSGSTISGNTAKSDGGALYLEGEAIIPGEDMNLDDAEGADGVFLGDTVFSENKSNGNGGAIAAVGTGYLFFWTPTDEQPTGVQFNNNKATGSGGAIYVGGKVYIGAPNHHSGFGFDGNQAGGSGGALFCDDKEARIEILGEQSSSKEKTTFTNNVASMGGGALYLNMPTDYTVHIDNAEFTGNSARNGGAIFFKKQLYMRNVTVTGNTATTKGGGVYCDNTSYYDFAVGGLMRITGNTQGTSSSKSVNSNLVLKGDQTVCDESYTHLIVSDEKLGASEIGVTVEDLGKSGRRISGNSSMLTIALGDDWNKVVYSDNPTRTIYRDGNYLYMGYGEAKYQLQVIGYDKTDAFEIEDASSVSIKSSDYPKTVTKADGSTVTLYPGYWTVTSTSGGTSTVTPTSVDVDGIATFTLLGGPTTARAHYGSALAEVEGAVTDKDEWDGLTSWDASTDTEKAYNGSVGYLTLTTADGATFTYGDAVTEGYCAVTKRSVTDSGDRTKSISYTVKMDKSLLDIDDLTVDASTLTAQFDTVYSKLDKSMTSQATCTDGGDGSLYFTYTVELVNNSDPYKVTFDPNEGELDDKVTNPVEVAYGKTLGESMPDDESVPTPVREGYRFAGWYTGKTDGTRVWSDTPINKDVASSENVTLYAHWAANEQPIYIVSFYVNDAPGEEFSAIDFECVLHDTLATERVYPTLKGYTFDGWYTKDGTDGTEDAWGVKFDFENMKVTSDINLYGKWVKSSDGGDSGDTEDKKVTITLDLGFGESDEVEIDRDTVFAEPEHSDHEGYTFDGWYKGSVKYDFTQKVTKDLTLTARFNRIVCNVTFDAGKDASAVDSQTVAWGGYAGRPADPTKKGYTFKSWQLDGEDYDFTTQVKSDIKLMATWTKNPDYVTVTFDAANGSDDAIETMQVEKGGAVGVLPTPEWEGHAFKGWFDGETKVTKETVVDTDKTFTAKWETEKYTVKFETNGGSAVNDQTVEYNGKVSTPDAPMRKGHKFVGWYNQQGGAFDFDNTKVTSDLTLYAMWTPETYTVTFDTQGGVPQPDAQPVKYNETVSVPENPPAREGYLFRGWYTDKDCSDAYDFNKGVSSDLKLYAGWTALVSVTFDADGGTAVEESPVTLVQGGRLDYLPETTRDGFTFLGWYVKTSDDADKPADSTVNAYTTFNSNTTLVAKWRENAGGGDTPDTSDWCLVTYKSEDLVVDYQKVAQGKTTSHDKIEREGYKFTGWYTDKSCKNEYNFDTAVTTDITLYAGWDIKSYTVKFETNGGTPAIDDQTVEFGGTASAPDAPSYTGKIFAGWYSDEKLTKAYDFSNAVTKDITLYAKWEDEATTHTVTFDSKGGSVVEPQVVKDGDVADEPVTDPAKNGYTFVTWYKDEACTERYNFKSAVTKDITVYAGWHARKFTVSFNSDGGSEVDAQKGIEYGETATEPKDPTKENFTFKEWQLGGEKYSFKTKVTSDIELTAVWEEKGGDNPDGGETTYCRVSFDSDGGTSVSSQKVKSGRTANEPSVPTKKGKTFKGWQLDGTDYDFDAAVTSDIELKAVWESDGSEVKDVYHTVTFNSDGGSDVSSQSVKDGNTANEPGEPTKKGYTFKGWQLDGADYDFNAAVTKDIELKAVWEKDSTGGDTDPDGGDTDPDEGEKVKVYTVTFDSNGGSSVKAQKVIKGETATEPKDPTKDGFVFKGWQLDGADYNFDAAVTKDITLKAVWQEKGTDGGTDPDGGKTDPDGGNTDPDGGKTDGDNDPDGGKTPGGDTTPDGGTTPSDGTTDGDKTPNGNNGSNTPNGSTNPSGESDKTGKSSSTKNSAKKGSALAGTGDLSTTIVGAVVLCGAVIAAIGFALKRKRE